jgi:hypothetical protein
MAIKVKYTSQLKKSAKQGIILYKSVSMVALVPLLSSYNFVESGQLVSLLHKVIPQNLFYEKTTTLFYINAKTRQRY